ncbi:hypothetical protein J1N35_040851 [Gossypium stocksii]|uniref:Uncharacterized protein n=1 Tax=Gossypium stocksii TaxID=47602 RepID=A0A9D3UEW2_9ROSI|nr:hypothetical protein J1N35_040851 [Gossypium stocksii]
MEASDNRTEGGRGIVSTGSALTVSTPKFKQCSVSAIRDFPPGCGRVTASNYGLTVSAVGDFPPRYGRVTTLNYGLTRKIVIDHSSEGDGAQDYLVLYVISRTHHWPFASSWRSASRLFALADYTLLSL